MFAGPEGLSVRDIIGQAAALQVATWEPTRSRQTNVSTVINSEANIVHVGGSRYAHKAFPGKHTLLWRLASALASCLCEAQQQTATRKQPLLCLRCLQELCPKD